MKLRHISLAVVALFAIGPAFSHADDGLRLVAITAARVTSALGFTPMNPANNLSDVTTPTTARTNLGLGTAATANTGTSGSALCLENTACTWSGQQTYTGSGGGLSSVLLFSGATSLGWLYTNGAVDNRVWDVVVPGSQWILRAVNDANSAATPAITVSRSGPTVSRVDLGGEFGLSKMTPSGTAPGAGTAKLAVVAGTNTGTCKIIAYAGTSATPVTIVDNVGAGC